ncbi:MAG: YraN family protein [Armatimonadetes bacterium]|nr:YraN family protein [Armatimonadota bacterium]
MKNKQFIGKSGEEIAANYLLKKGHKILFRNYHSQFGEIDIIALDKDTLAFIEVKTRSSNFETAFSSVSFSKQQKLTKTALYFISKNYEYEDFLTRFDVIVVLFDQREEYRIKHLVDAFLPDY